MVSKTNVTRQYDSWTHIAIKFVLFVCQVGHVTYTSRTGVGYGMGGLLEKVGFDKQCTGGSTVLPTFSPRDA
jgi:hypothetical protein